MEVARDRTVALPRSIDVLRFLAAREPEVTALHNSVKQSDRLIQGHTLPRYLRRRARSHNPYRHLKRPNAKLAPLRIQQQEEENKKNDGMESDIEVQTTATYTNRRMRRRRAKLQGRFTSSAQWSQEGLRNPANDSVRRLETHLWHVKRLSMIENWGWMLPEGELGRGRGSRSFVKRLSSKPIVHDASYWCPLLVSGLSGELVSMLTAVLDPADIPEVGFLLESGNFNIERQFVLHAPGSFPAGAVCPIILSAINGAASILDTSNDNADIDEQCHLLVWLHGAAASQAYAALSSAIKSRECMGISMQVKNLRRIEVRGQGADGAVAKALFHHTTAPSQPFLSPVERQKDILVPLPKDLLDLEPAEMQQIIIPDPRIARPLIVGSGIASLLAGITAPKDLNLLAGRNVDPPAPESRISVWRRQLRDDFFGLSDPFVTATLPPILLREPKIDGQFGAYCPLLYVRQPWGSNVPGCSLIVPAGWTVPIWQALTYAGCKAAGQREWQWLHTLLQLPFFPHDAPDTPTYNATMLVLRQKQQHEAGKRPKGRYTTKQELPPSWETVSTLQSEPSDGQQQQQQQGVTNKPLVVIRNCKLATHIMTSEPHLGETSYLVQVLVQPVKKGSVEPGASLCILPYTEAMQFDKQPWYYHSRVGLSRQPYNGEDDKTSTDQVVAAARPVVIGYVCSPAPYGTSRSVNSIALCSIPALWKLRSQQAERVKRDRGAVIAYFQNPGSTAIFPARIRLLLND